MCNKNSLSANANALSHIPSDLCTITLALSYVSASNICSAHHMDDHISKVLLGYVQSDQSASSIEIPTPVGPTQN